jgi:hypothetical protein
LLRLVLVLLQLLYLRVLQMAGLLLLLLPKHVQGVLAAP